MTAILADVDVMVEGAFDELECCIPTTTRHGPHHGERAAYFSLHGCRDEGWLCAAHLQWLNDVYISQMLTPVLTRHGYVRHSDCNRAFTSVDDFIKVMTL